MQLTANVYVETEYWGANVGYVTTEQGLVLIESPQRPTDAMAWRKQIEGKGTLKYLINTEGHADHAAGDYFFAAPVIAHEKARGDMLAADRTQILKSMAQLDPEGVSLAGDYQIKAPAATTFSERLTLYLGSHTFHLINTPGHTAGQTTVFIPEERIAFTGDNVNYKKPAFFLPSEPFAWLRSLGRMRELDIDYIVPGHGEVCDKRYLAEWSSYIQEWIDSVRKAINQGWSKEEAINKVTLPNRFPLPPDSDQMAARMRVRSISRLYDVLSQE